MKQNEIRVNERIEEICNYLLCHNMADISPIEFHKLTSELHSLTAVSENKVLKSYRTASYMDSYQFVKL